MAFVEDLSPFLSDFGVAVALPEGTSVTAIFDNAHAGAFNGLVGDTDPVLTGKASDFVSLIPGSVVGVGTTGYSVAAIEPDGTGISILRLKDRDPNGFDNGFSSGFGA